MERRYSGAQSGPSPAEGSDGCGEYRWASARRREQPSSRPSRSRLRAEASDVAVWCYTLRRAEGLVLLRSIQATGSRSGGSAMTAVILMFAVFVEPALVTVFTVAVTILSVIASPRIVMMPVRVGIPAAIITIVIMIALIVAVVRSSAVPRLCGGGDRKRQRKARKDDLTEHSSLLVAAYAFA